MLGCRRHQALGAAVPVAPVPGTEQVTEFGVWNCFFMDRNKLWVCLVLLFFKKLFFLQPHQPPLQSDSLSQSSRNGNEKAELCVQVECTVLCSPYHP